MTPEQAWDVLRKAGWKAGVSLVGHPKRAECKAALAALRAAGVDPRRLEKPTAAAPKRWSKHVRCAMAAVLGLLVGFAFVAYGQETGPPPPPSDFEGAWRLAQTVGLPGVVAWASWVLRGLLATGITVRLSDEDRELLRKPGAP